YRGWRDCRHGRDRAAALAPGARSHARGRIRARRRLRGTARGPGGGRARGRQEAALRGGASVDGVGSARVPALSRALLATQPPHGGRPLRDDALKRKEMAPVEATMLIGGEWRAAAGHEEIDVVNP